MRFQAEAGGATAMEAGKLWNLLPGGSPHAARMGLRLGPHLQPLGSSHAAGQAWQCGCPLCPEQVTGESQAEAARPPVVLPRGTHRQHARCGPGPLLPWKPWRTPLGAVRTVAVEGRERAALSPAGPHPGQVAQPHLAGKNPRVAPTSPRRPGPEMRALPPVWAFKPGAQLSPGSVISTSLGSAQPPTGFGGALACAWDRPGPRCYGQRAAECTKDPQACVKRGFSLLALGRNSLSFMLPTFSLIPANWDCAGPSTYPTPSLALWGFMPYPSWSFPKILPG